MQGRGQKWAGAGPRLRLELLFFWVGRAACRSDPPGGDGAPPRRRATKEAGPRSRFGTETVEGTRGGLVAGCACAPRRGPPTAARDQHPRFLSPGLPPLSGLPSSTDSQNLGHVPSQVPVAGARGNAAAPVETSAPAPSPRESSERVSRQSRHGHKSMTTGRGGETGLGWCRRKVWWWSKNKQKEMGHFLPRQHGKLDRPGHSRTKKG